MPSSGKRKENTNRAPAPDRQTIILARSPVGAFYSRSLGRFSCRAVAVAQDWRCVRAGLALDNGRQFSSTVWVFSPSVSQGSNGNKMECGSGPFQRCAREVRGKARERHRRGNNSLDSRRAKIRNQVPSEPNVWQDTLGTRGWGAIVSATGCRASAEPRRNHDAQCLRRGATPGGEDENKSEQIYRWWFCRSTTGLFSVVRREQVKSGE